MASRQPTDEGAASVFARLAALDLSQNDLADAIGLEADKVSKVKVGVRQFRGAELMRALNWLNGKERDRDRGVTPTAPDRPPSRDASAGETVEIIQLDLSLPMGDGASVDDYIEEEPRQFDLAYIRGFTRTPPHRLRIARGVGDSMFPTLQSSDMVWIDSTQTQLNQADRIWAVSINGMAAIKRLRRTSLGRVMIVSDNPAIENYEVAADELLIGGRVIRFARDV